MEDEVSAHEKYEVIPDPTGTGISAGNEIVEIDAHLEERDKSDPRPQPSLSSDDLSILADELVDLDADEQSARVEIERRYMVDHGDNEHILRFTVATLTKIAIVLAIARVRATYASDDTDDIKSAIHAFGHTIEESHTAPLDGKTYGLELDGVEPQSGDYIDPFRVLTGKQTLFFVDEEGERIAPDDPDDNARDALDS